MQTSRRCTGHLQLALLVVLVGATDFARGADIATSPRGAAAAGGSPIQPFMSVPGPAAPVLEIAQGHILIRIARDARTADVRRAATEMGLGLRGRVHGSRWFTFSLPQGADPGAAARIAADLPGVDSATVDAIVPLLDHVVSRDPLYVPADDACDPFIEVCANQWGLFKVGAPAAWHETTGTSSVIIAVLDSGVDLDHDDLIDKLWTNTGEVAGNAIDDDHNGLVDDVNGADFVGDPATGDADDNNFDGYADPGVFHGTAVAGIAAAMTDSLQPASATSFEGMAGACWSCRIMPVRMTNAEGYGFASDAASALRYAVDMGADIAVASWGLPADGLAPDSPELAVLVEALDYALDGGLIVVAAAGNGGGPGLHFPAANRRVIAVGSSSPDDEVSSFSSYAHAGEVSDNGIDDDRNGWVDDVVDVIAPGEGIWSSWVLGAYDSLIHEALLGLDGWPSGADTYSAADGTSFSTPLVAGYLGLLLSRHPDATPAQLRSILRSSAVDLAPAGYDPQAGFGRLRMLPTR